MSNPVIISGSPLPPQRRLEIKQFIQDQEQLSLYVQALTEMQASKDPNLSFFSIAGIHGRPYVSWDGVPAPSGRGYCRHGTQQFPTWHRPYVVLLEQEIHKRALIIANGYRDQSKWQSVATNLRQPYWDWADPAGIFPDSLSDFLSAPTVKILVAPNAQEQSVSNPFCRYDFKDGEKDGFPTLVSPPNPPNPPETPNPFKTWPHTLRHPTSLNPNAQSNVERLKRTLRSPMNDIRGKTERLFSINTWSEFSNHSQSSDIESANSLEGIHDTMHVLIGGRSRPYGHMSDPQYAGFDPLFYLHHAQVDRLVDQWYNAKDRREWAPPDNLSPFRDNRDTFWSSGNIKEPASFGYSYAPRIGFPLPGDSILDQSSHKSSKVTAQFTSITEWTVRIRCKKFELGGNFSVLFFLKDSDDPNTPGVPDIPTDRDELFFEPNFVGSFDTFVNSHPEDCTNCQEHIDDIISGFVHINKVIMQKRDSNELDPDTVVPFLKERLNWIVLKADGTIVDPPSLFTSLVVEVIATPLTDIVGAFPGVGKPEIYHEITHGKPGGSDLKPQ